MKRDQYNDRLQKIVARLEEIFEQDLAVVQPRSGQSLTISHEQLVAYGERFEERQKLHDELRSLAVEPIED